MDAAALESFLQQVRPGLTLYGTLLTFAVISFLIGKYFWNYEKGLREENLSRLRSLLAGYRERYIDPIVRDKLVSSFKVGYESAVDVVNSQIESAEDEQQSDLSEVPSQMDKLRATLSSREERRTDSEIADRVDRYLASSTGLGLFERLDQCYEEKSQLASSYHKACNAAAHVAYAFLTLFLLMTLGILRILGGWHVYLVLLWTLVSGQALVYGVFSFVRLEVWRRRLLHSWERMELHGQV